MQKTLLFPICKINIGLYVVEKRPDGYHNLQTLFYPVGLTDSLEICEPRDRHVPYALYVSGVKNLCAPEDNIVVKTYLALKEEFDLPPVEIFLGKRIPTGAGLGGGSSDAAEMIKGLNERFRLGLTDEDMRRRIARFGADCAFFIYGWCGLPAMGTAGAAVATVIGQAVGAGLGLFFHLKRNREVPLGLKFFRPNGRIIGEIYEIGFPSIIMMCIGSLTNYIMNLLLVSFTKTAVAVYGAYFKLQSFFFMPVFGINNGLIPIIGYNYGAGKVDRIHRTIKYGVLFAAVFMLTGLALFELAPGLLLSAFNPSAEMLDIGTHALRRIAVHFPIAAFCIVAGSACQALNKSMFSLITSCMRQIFALIPAAYLLSLTGDVNNIWWCFLIAEIVSFVFSFFFLRKAMRDADRRLLA